MTHSPPQLDTLEAVRPSALCAFFTVALAALATALNGCTHVATQRQHLEHRALLSSPAPLVSVDGTAASDLLEP
jgi:hypothetical protein